MFPRTAILPRDEAARIPLRSSAERSLPKIARQWLAAMTCAVVGMLPLEALAANINPPIGSYTNPAPEELLLGMNFSSNAPVVVTSYFYWYDVYYNAHILNSDGSDALTDHPVTMTGFSYQSAAWHKAQLKDMIAAGINVAVPVYWGEPSQRKPGRPIQDQPWSFAGLPPLVQARQELLDAGEKPPAIGMFYDTSTLQFNDAGKRIDLTTDEGRRWFYESIRDFFSLIPARHWAMVEGRPIIFLYSSAFAAKHDQTCVDYVRQEFAKDFSGRVPYIVREVSWNVIADNTYAWGGAVSFRNNGVAALGPGYDHSAVPNRDPLVVPREDGAFFERSWVRLLRAPTKIVHVETWNEFHEGTDIAESREYGRKYIELNRKYSDMFRAGIKPPRPRGPFSDYKNISIALGPTNTSQGITQIEQPDGLTSGTNVAGSAARTSVPGIHAGKYIYFQIHESYKWASLMTVDVNVEYFDAGSGTLRVEYDGSDSNAPLNGSYTQCPTDVQLGNTSQWKTGKFRLMGARLLNSQNGGSDFRISIQAPGLILRKVTVSRLGMPAESGALLNGWQQDFSTNWTSNWQARGVPGVFSTIGGTLRVQPSESPASLAAGPWQSANAPWEVLTRLRILSQPPGPALLATISMAEGCSVSISSLQNGANELVVSTPGNQVSRATTGPLHTNRWYWLRVLHQPLAASGAPDVLAKLWPANGEAIEPPAWMVWSDYYPSAAAAIPEAGIVAGSGMFELDWLLLKSQLFQLIASVPPARKPALASLGILKIAGALRIEARGEPGMGYLLESSTDLQSWVAKPVTADNAGLAAVTEPLNNSQARFYRTSLVQ